jgi:hypothetical protein
MNPCSGMQRCISLTYYNTFKTSSLGQGEVLNFYFLLRIYTPWLLTQSKGESEV